MCKFDWFCPYTESITTMVPCTSQSMKSTPVTRTSAGLGTTMQGFPTITVTVGMCSVVLVFHYWFIFLLFLSCINSSYCNSNTGVNWCSVVLFIKEEKEVLYRCTFWNWYAKRIIFTCMEDGSVFFFFFFILASATQSNPRYNTSTCRSELTIVCEQVKIWNCLL